MDICEKTKFLQGSTVFLKYTNNGCHQFRAIIGNLSQMISVVLITLSFITFLFYSQINRTIFLSGLPSIVYTK